MGALAGGFLCALAAVAMHGYKCGYKDGHRAGLKAGCDASGNWFIDAERGVDLARRQIWREQEPKEGRWL